MLICTVLATGGPTAVTLSAGAPAYAGQWVEVSCVNPSQSAAPSEGWTSFAAGGGYGSNSGTGCGPGSPMYAILSTDAAVGVGSAETLQFTPPPGSRLVGGATDVSMYADGFGYNASGTAVAYSPEYAYNGTSVFFQCAHGLTPCANGTNDFAGVLGIPGGRGGNLYLSAGCGGEGGQACNSGGSEGGWSLVRLWWANLLLESSTAPSGSGFSGSLLAPGAHGTADLQLSATDPSGPGVYLVTLQIDGHTAYQGTPDGNAGHCVAVGSAWGAWMFDYQQPCKQAETVDVPLDTTGLTDGPHTLKVIVTDAAQNSSVVYDGTITTANRTTVSALLSSPLASTPGSEPSYAIVLDRPTEALGRHIRRSFLGSALTLSGELRDPSGVPVLNATISLVAQDGNPPAGALIVLARTSSDAAGQWVLHAPTGPSRLLRIVSGGAARQASLGGGVALTETVSPILGLRVRTPGGARLVFSGHLAISPLGAPRPLVIIETRAGPAWEGVGTPVRVARDGSYRFVYRSSPLTLGRRFAFRAVTPATSLWPTATSRVRSAVVR
ncbi:MAG TPA: hypothetical protein VNZ01_14730 [Solirubrobacteraceae bacterium]|nr:hypothetical protein [Solirubrobacteraceae bacterium]